MYFKERINADQIDRPTEANVVLDHLLFNCINSVTQPWFDMLLLKEWNSVYLEIDSPGPCYVNLPQNSLRIDLKVFMNAH